MTVNRPTRTRAHLAPMLTHFIEEEHWRPEPNAREKTELGGAAASDASKIVLTIFRSQRTRARDGTTQADRMF